MTRRATWRRVNELKAGDRIVTDGGVREIVSIEPVDKPGTYGGDTILRCKEEFCAAIGDAPVVVLCDAEDIVEVVV